MRAYSLSHVSDPELIHGLTTLVAQDRTTTARLLAHLAEFDARKLYLPAAYPPMFAYCVHELRLSEDAAYKRIQAARAARQFPALFPALADGRLHLAAVCLLAPHLTPGDADELLGAAAGKRKAELEEWLAQRFPRAELLPMVEALPTWAPPPNPRLAPGQVGNEPGARELADQHVPEPVAAAAPRSKLAPLAPERYALQLTIDGSTYQKLRYAQELLGHRIPSGDLAQVLDRALEALIE